MAVNREVFLSDVERDGSHGEHGLLVAATTPKPALTPKPTPKPASGATQTVLDKWGVPKKVPVDPNKFRDYD